MHPRFEAYRHTTLGVAIEACARKSERLIEYRLLSRLKMPAVIALSWDVAPLLQGLSEGDRRDAKQFCGAIVGDLMREDRHEMANPRGSAQVGGVFTLGAVWAPIPEADDERTVRISEQMTREYSDTLRTLAGG